MSTARSNSDRGGASVSGARGRGGAPATARIRFTPSSGPWYSSTSPSETTLSGPGSNSQSSPRRMARTHMPVGVAEVGPERVGYPELRRHDPRDVGGRVSDLVDGARDPQHALDGLGVLGTPGGQDGERSEAAEVPGHPLLELLDLIGHVLVVEEDRRVGHIDQELGGVLGFDQELFDVPRFVLIH